MRELVQSDRAVKELTVLLGEPQNLVSYHLRLLRDGRTRDDAPELGRRARQLLLDRPRRLPRRSPERGPRAASCARTSRPPTRPCTALGRSRRRPRVLFLCTGNSARSQIAEALLERMSGGAIEPPSAGSHPEAASSQCRPRPAKRGIDISGNRTKHVDEFIAQRFDTVITLCDRVREVCPEFPSEPERVHWSVPDPAARGCDQPFAPTQRSSAPRSSSRRASTSASFSSQATQRGDPHMPNDETINVRYMVDDVDASIAFYTELLGFELLTSAAPAFADVKRGNLRLLLSGPKSSAGRPMPDGATPGPGGWNRIHLDRRRHRHRSRTPPRRRRLVPQRRRGGAGREADPAPGPVRQRRGAVPARRSLIARTAGRRRPFDVPGNPMTDLPDPGRSAHSNAGWVWPTR